MALHNLARVVSATTGTGAITLGAAVSGFLTWANAGVADGEVVTYAIRDGAESEIGRGAYTASGTVQARTTIYESTNGGSAINLSGSEEVFITAAAEDLAPDGWQSSAHETWTYASADDPTYTFTISGDLTGKYQAGQRIKLTQTTVKYFIITKVEYSAPNTTVTIYGGTDYDLANAAISANYYSLNKAPFGFPLDPTKWEVKVTDTSIRSQSTPGAGTWYNLGSATVSIPIGAWRVSYKVIAQFADASTVSCTMATTLSTANNSETDAEFTARMFFATGIGQAWPIYLEKPLVLTSKTSYYLNTKVDEGVIDTIYNRGDVATTILRAVCAYL